MLTVSNNLKELFVAKCLNTLSTLFELQISLVCIPVTTSAEYHQIVSNLTALFKLHLGMKTSNNYVIDISLGISWHTHCTRNIAIERSTYCVLQFQPANV